MNFIYLLCLIASLGGLAILDYRFKLAFWYRWKQALLTVFAAMGFFIAWDILGILLGIFKHGTGNFNLAFTLAPEFPIEEIFFLALLCYSALILYRGIGLWRSRI